MIKRLETELMPSEATLKCALQLRPLTLCMKENLGLSYRINLVSTGTIRFKLLLSVINDL